MGSTYVEFLYDLKAEFGKGRVKVHATFDGKPYDESIVNMGVKDIRAKIGKKAGNTVKVIIKERK